MLLLSAAGSSHGYAKCSWIDHEMFCPATAAVDD
jgi:hypothetical protein